MGNFPKIISLAALLAMAVPAFAQEAGDELGQNPFEGMTQEQRREAYGNMSDAERKQIREQIRNNPDRMRKRMESMSPEQREKARKRFESMTPEQRQQMRERFKSQGGRGQRGGARQQSTG